MQLRLVPGVHHFGALRLVGTGANTERDALVIEADPGFGIDNLHIEQIAAPPHAMALAADMAARCLSGLRAEPGLLLPDPAEPGDATSGRNLQRPLGNKRDVTRPRVRS